MTETKKKNSKGFKKLVRKRMAETGETYVVAMLALRLLGQREQVSR